VKRVLINLIVLQYTRNYIASMLHSSWIFPFVTSLSLFDHDSTRHLSLAYYMTILAGYKRLSLFTFFIHELWICKNSRLLQLLRTMWQSIHVHDMHIWYICLFWSHEFLNGNALALYMIINLKSLPILSFCNFFSNATAGGYIATILYNSSANTNIWWLISFNCTKVAQSILRNVCLSSFNTFLCAHERFALDIKSSTLYMTITVTFLIRNAF